VNPNEIVCTRKPNADNPGGIRQTIHVRNHFERKHPLVEHGRCETRGSATGLAERQQGSAWRERTRWHTASTRKEGFQKKATMTGHKQVARNYQENFQPSASTKCSAKQPESVRVWLLLGNLDPRSLSLGWTELKWMIFCILDEGVHAMNDSEVRTYLLQ
jgi:hypothetical protein